LNRRPVYHQKDDSIKAHLLLTIIACGVVHFILHRLAKQGIHWSWKEVVRVMNTQKTVFSEFQNNNSEYILYSQWSKPEPKAAQIYDALKYEHARDPGFFFKAKNNST